MTQKVGRWGSFVQHGKVMATLPKNTDPNTVTLQLAIELLAAKAAKSNPNKKKKTISKKTSSANKAKPKPKKYSKDSKSVNE